MADQLLHFNGVDGDSGQYAVTPLSATELTQAIQGQSSPDNLQELRQRAQQAATRHLGLKEGVDPKDLSQAGWGVILPAHGSGERDQQKAVAAIQEALQPLLALRSQQAGARFEAWTQGSGKGFRIGADNKNKYLARHGMGPGPADPDKVPYYLMIVGSPADIPYRFQTQLDVQYAVGRIHFATLDEYAEYAASVVAAETGGLTPSRRAAFFGMANEDDLATQRSAAQLIDPLATRTQAEHPEWTVQTFARDRATKANLSALLGGPEMPAILFTASHGMGFASDSPRQVPHQGALLCQDWPGPKQWRGAIPPEFYLAGDDLAAEANLLGLIAFFFACFGAGTPQFDEFNMAGRPGVATGSRKTIAGKPFLAQLPQRMLARPRGALAVVGHVDRTWSYAFDWGQAGAQTTVFESMLKRLLEGHPVGSALEYFNQRYAELSTLLSDELEEIQFGRRFDPYELAGLWTANNDARGFAVIGDPAVRLPLAVTGGLAPAQIVPEIRTRSSSSGQAPGTTDKGLIDQQDAGSPPPAPSSFSISVPGSSTMTEVRTYVSSNLNSPAPGDLKIVTRRSADGTLETVVAADVAQNAGLLALHQALVVQADS